ncbi:MAG: hypothetical protein HZA14_02910 [Nitrospirae bacterium]|nr:hypothetical protein [Nitrospirota bacterium]
MGVISSFIAFASIIYLPNLSYLAFYAFEVAYLTFTAYAIVKHRLMDIKVVISRTAAWVLATALLMGIYFGGVWLYLSYVSREIGAWFLTGNAIYGIMVGEMFHRIRLFFQTSSDKLFLRGKYDYYKELSEASSRVVARLSVPEILKVLYDTFYNVVEIGNPRIYLPENFGEVGGKTERYVYYDRETSRPRKDVEGIEEGGELVKELKEKRKVRFGVKEMEAAVVVPCFTEEKLTAIMVLGPKLTEEGYTDEDLRLLGILGSQAAVALDHTRYIEEYRETQEKLYRSEKLASIGKLAGAIGHDLRNPLGVIKNSVFFLNLKLGEGGADEKVKKHIGIIEKEVETSTRIIEDILSFARVKMPELKAEDIGSLLKDSLYRIPVPEDIKVIKEIAEDLPPAMIDRGQIDQVFSNLILNAYQAMADGGTLKIKAKVNPTIVGKDRELEISFEDTGMGIPPEVLPKIFEPLFTTKVKGTGLGLSICHSIIEGHKGRLEVESTVGKGTTFRVRLPG